MDGEGDLRWIWILDGCGRVSNFYCNRIGMDMDFWMAMDESIRMERVDVMWCRLGNRMRRISFVIGILEFV